MVNDDDKITSLKQFIEKYETALQSDYNNPELRLYYRGEDKDNKDTRCLPSLYRTDVKEKENYYKFLRRHPEEFKGLTNLDVLSKMQHYCIPTRLLDITTNPLVALFFACYGNNSISNGHVFAFKASKTNILTYDSDRALLLSTLPKISSDDQFQIKDYLEECNGDEITPEIIDALILNRPNQGRALRRYIYECERERDAFKDHHVVPSDLSEIYYVKPQFTNLRMKLQSSLFMLFGISNSNHNRNDKYFMDKVSRKSVVDIVIARDAKKRILSELKFVCGISYSSLFGNIESTVIENKEQLYETFNRDVLGNSSL